MAPNTPLWWDSEKTFELIRNFQMFPELWNSRVKEYREKDKRAIALKKIADTLGMSVVEINRKWHNLRCQMNSEIRKWKWKSSAGGGNNVAWKSSWEFFDSLRFMSRYSESLKSTGSLPVNLEPSASGKCGKPKAVSSTARKRKVPDEVVQEQGHEQETKQLKEELPLMNRPPDDNTVFGEFVASELRQLRSEERRRRLKRTIQKAIIAIEEEEEDGRRREVEEELQDIPQTSPGNPLPKSYPPHGNQATSFSGL